MATKTSLDVIRLDLPCQVPWDAMAGDERRRFCTQCNLHVHNLSVMTEDEAARFVDGQTGRVCVAYLQAADGSAMFAERDCDGAAAGATPVIPYRSASMAKRRRWLVPAAVAGAVVTAGAATALGPHPIVPAGVAKSSTTMPVMLAGAIMPAGPMQLDPRAAAAAQKGDWTEPKVTHASLKTDAFGAPLLKRLSPLGLDVVEVEYNAYPLGFKPTRGQVFLIGRQSARGEPGDETPVVDAVLWLLPTGAAKSGAATKPSTLRAVGKTRKFDAYLDVDTPKIVRAVRGALAAADGKK